MVIGFLGTDIATQLTCVQDVNLAQLINIITALIAVPEWMENIGMNFNGCTNIDMAIKEAWVATYRMLAMAPDYSESGKELKSKTMKEYKEAMMRLVELEEV